MRIVRGEGCGLRGEGSRRLSGENIAFRGSKAELRHACVEPSTRSRTELAEPVLLVYPNKEASDPLDREKIGKRVRVEG